jgi:hypothetical protein
LRFGAAGSGLDRHDGVEVVVLAREESSCFKFGDVVIRGTEFPVELLEQIIFLLRVCLFLCKMDVGLNVGGYRSKFFVGSDLFFCAFPVAQNALCGFLVVPETGLGNARFEGFQVLAILWRVKDSSARA